MFSTKLTVACDWDFTLVHKYYTNWVYFEPRLYVLTLLVPGQGHNGPGDWNKVCHIHNIRARSIKILDFVPFYVWMVLENSFLEFVFEIFCKTEKKNFDRRHSVPTPDKMSTWYSRINRQVESIAHDTRCYN